MHRARRAGTIVGLGVNGPADERRDAERRKQIGADTGALRRAAARPAPIIVIAVAVIHADRSRTTVARRFQSR